MGLPGRKDPAACGGVRVERRVRQALRLPMREVIFVERNEIVFANSLQVEKGS
jgi:hypothetical protein